MRPAILRTTIGIAALAQGALAQGNIPTALLREEMRIVSNESSVNTSLTGVSPGSIVLRDGRILTVHRTEATVRVFDANGRFVTKFGRAGDGPGEFRSPLAAGTLGDSIWVFDERRRVYEIFAPDFKPVARLTMPRTVNIPQFGLAPGRLTTAVVGFGDTARAFIYGPDTSLVRPVVFQFKQREHRFEIDDPGVPRTVTDDAGTRTIMSFRGVRSMRSPIGAGNDLVMSQDGRDVFAVEPGETWGGRPGQLRFSRVSMATGQLSAPITVTLPARPIPRAERDSIIDAYARQSARIESQVRGGARLPDYYPPYMSIRAMGDGLIWIQEYTRPQERIAIDASGRVLMRIRLPESLSVIAANRTHVWGVLRDANDLPIILRYRIAAQ